MEADKASGTRDQYCLIRHHILNTERRPVRPAVPFRASLTAVLEGVAIPSCPAIARLALKPYQGGEVRRAAPICAVLRSFSNLASAGEMRRILLSTIKILISAALLYFALRKVNLSELASRIHIASLGWIGAGDRRDVPADFCRRVAMARNQRRMRRPARDRGRRCASI